MSTVFTLRLSFRAISLVVVSFRDQLQDLALARRQALEQADRLAADALQVGRDHVLGNRRAQVRLAPATARMACSSSLGLMFFSR